MPDTKPGITFDENGVCNACLYMEQYLENDWDERWTALEHLRDTTAFNPGYHAVVAVSGGKDSHYLAHLVRDKLHLNPLLVCVEPCYPTKLGVANLNNLSSLGYDTFVFKPNARIMPTLLKRSFIEDGQPAGAFEFMLYTVPVRIAMAFDIPLVFWGEGGAMYGNSLGDASADAMDQKQTSAIAGRDATHWISEGVERKDLQMFQHPTAEEMEAAGVRNIYMSDYVSWDSHINADWAIRHGLGVRPEGDLWKAGAYWGFEQLDDEIPVVSHFLKFLKYGYGRATDQACRDIRWGRLPRHAGLAYSRYRDGQIDLEYIRRYCEYLGISVYEFWVVLDSWRGDFWEKSNGSWVLPEDWDIL
jgi:N-acetyl sugar amidotransferase